MTEPKGRRAIQPDQEERGTQAAALRRRQRRGRVAAGDEGIGANPDAHPVEETLEDDPGRS